MSHALLSSEASNTQSNNPNDAFLSAIESGDVAAAKQWLANGASLDAKKEGRNALSLAASEGRLEAVKFLVEECHIPVDEGACRCDEAKRLECKCETALAAAFNARDAIVGNRYFAVCQYLLGKGANVNTTYKYDFLNERVPLLFSATSSDSDSSKIVDLLLTYKADSNAKTSSGLNLFHLAIMLSCKELFEFLIKKGADIEEKVKGKSAWMRAVSMQSSPFAEKLLSINEAFLQEIDEEGYSAFQNYGSELITYRLEQSPLSVERERVQMWGRQLEDLLNCNQFSDEAWVSVDEGFTFYGESSVYTESSVLPEWFTRQYDPEILQDPDFLEALQTNFDAAWELFFTNMQTYLTEIIENKFIPEKLDLFSRLMQKTLTANFMSSEDIENFYLDFFQDISLENVNVDTLQILWDPKGPLSLKNIFNELSASNELPDLPQLIILERNRQKLQNFTCPVCDQEWKLSNKKYCLDTAMLSKELGVSLSQCFVEIFGKKYVRLDNKILILEGVNEKHFQKLVSETARIAQQKLIKAKPKSLEERQSELKEKLVELISKIEKLRVEDEKVKKACLPYLSCLLLLQDKNDKKNAHKKRIKEKLRVSYDKLSSQNFSRNFSALQSRANSLQEKIDSPQDLEANLKEFDEILDLYNIIERQVRKTSSDEMEARNIFTEKELNASIRQATIVQQAVPPHIDHCPSDGQKKIAPQKKEKAAQALPPKEEKVVQGIAPKEGKEKVVQGVAPKKEKEEVVSSNKVKEKAIPVPKAGKEEADASQKIKGQVSPKAGKEEVPKTVAANLSLPFYQETDAPEMELSEVTRTKKGETRTLSEFEGNIKSKTLPSHVKIQDKAAANEVAIAAAPNGMLGVALDNYDLLNLDFNQHGNAKLCFYAACYELMRMFHALGALPVSVRIGEFLSIDDALNIRNNIMHYLMNPEVDQIQIERLIKCLSFLKGQYKFKVAMQKLKEGVPLSFENFVALREIPFLHELLETKFPPTSVEKNIQVIKLHLNYLIDYKKIVIKLDDQAYLEPTLLSAIKMSIATIGQKIKELPSKEKNKIYSLISAFTPELLEWDKDKEHRITCFEKLRDLMGHDLEKGVEQSPVTVTFDEVSPFVLLAITEKAETLETLLRKHHFFDPPNPPALAALQPVLSTLSGNVPLGYPKFFPAQGQPVFPALGDTLNPAPKPSEKQSLNPAAKPWTPPKFG